MKSQNPSVLGQGDLVGTHQPYPSMFYHWRPSFGHRGGPSDLGTGRYPQKQVLGCRPGSFGLTKIFYITFPFILFILNLFLPISSISAIFSRATPQKPQNLNGSSLEGAENFSHHGFF